MFNPCHIATAPMLKSLIFILFFLGICSLTQAQRVFLNYFSINSDGADIVLEWEVQDESMIVEYQLFRTINNEQIPTFVTKIDPDGSNKYQFLDDNIYKATPRVINYQLEIHLDDKTVQKEFAAISHNPTSIQRTWGSIKAMFR